jgi:nitrite reductase (NADH) small subunit
MSWTSLCELGELREGQGRYAEVGGFQLAVFLYRGQVYVIDNTCPHAGGNLAAGHVEEGCAVCPLHRWSFQLDSGKLEGSAAVMVQTYRSRLLHRQDRPTLVQAELPIY